jgi:glycosyltransferase involved in cell wall biosynthesis
MADVQVLKNAAFEAAAVAAAASADGAAAPPLISVLVPFYRFDCSALVARLSELAGGEPLALELVLADDGSPQPAFADAVWRALQASAVPATLLRFARNQGRAVIRNQLARAARGPFVLYLDADMMPDEPDYLQQYLELARQGAADIVYGGRSAKFCDPADPAVQLHRHFTQLREAIPLAVRVQAPAYHFYSCNFMARREVLETVPLDEKFVGWGWEDMEWAARASERYTLLHIDNPASHLGLLAPGQILAKYDESVGNFQRMLALRPAMVLPTSLYKAARLFGRLRVGGLVRPLARWLALAGWAPMRLRIACLSFYKAALYSAVV